MAPSLPAGSVLLLALCLSNLPKLSSSQNVWRFFLTENYTKTQHICDPPPYSHNYLQATTDCPTAGCSRPIQLNFSRFYNSRVPFPVLCYHYKQPETCKTSSWHSCLGCVWMNSCALEKTREKGRNSPSLLTKTDALNPQGVPTGNNQFTLTIPDPWNPRWTSSQKTALYDFPGQSYPSSHLYIWRAYVLISVSASIQKQEQALTTHLQPHNTPFSWIALLREGLALANQSGLTNLTSCLLCATLGQTPLVAVLVPFPRNASESSNLFTPIPNVQLYALPESQLPACYSLGHNYSYCNHTRRVSTSLTAPRGIFFWCNGTLTKTLPSNQPPILLCLPVTLVPRLTVYSPAEFLLLQVPQDPSHHTRRAAFLPVAVGLSLAGSALAAGLGGGALLHSHQALARLSSQLQAAIEDSTASLASLQRQITSVAQVALQNRRALDLLTAERGRTCIFLQEECCYYVNESGQVEMRIENLQKIKTSLQNYKFSTEGSAWWSSSMYTLLSPLLGPLLVICLVLLIAPCFFHFLQWRFQELTRVTINQMMLQPVFHNNTIPTPAPQNNHVTSPPTSTENYALQPTSQTP
uniref:Transmembrane protein n=1 Tax=Saimiri boliviensis boliviensis TaxID=39432 RepID=A0A2K6SA48_SAIBB